MKLVDVTVEGSGVKVTVCVVTAATFKVCVTVAWLKVEQDVLALTLYRASRRFRRLDVCGQQDKCLAKIEMTHRLFE